MATQETGEGWQMISTGYLATMIQSNPDKVLVIDSRSFLEYNTSHVVNAVNVCCSKLVKRRLQQGKVKVVDLLAQTCQIDTAQEQQIIVYDQCSTHTDQLSPDCFLLVLLHKLVATFSSVALLKGGFLEFQACHAALCESKTTTTTSSGGYKCPPMTSMSQPAMPVSNLGPTRILPFLYLGSQQDALSSDVTQQSRISYILNVSTTSPRPSHILEGHFLRLPVNDNYKDKLLPLFPQAFQFLDKVRETGECVLIHCLAGISRSATVAIAYLMYHLNFSSDEAYKYVKDKRPTISPNFNFLGQLLEFEKQRQAEKMNLSTPLTCTPLVAMDTSDIPPISTTSATQTDARTKDEAQNHMEHSSVVVKKQCTQDLSSPITPSFSLALSAVKPANGSTTAPKAANFALRKKPLKPFVFNQQAFSTKPLAVQSPTTALSRLSFGTVSPVTEEPNTPATPVTPSGGDNDNTATGRNSSEQPPIPFSLMPTTSLDSLSFTPCFAGASQEPSKIEVCAHAQRRRDSSPGLSSSANTTGLNNNSKACKGGNHCAKSPTAGSKRPLSSSLELKLGGVAYGAVEQDISTNTQGQSSVTVARDDKNTKYSSAINEDSGLGCEIAEVKLRAKRPLVRPNSIAFSSYPLFDQPGQQNEATAVQPLQSSQIPVCSQSHSIAMDCSPVKQAPASSMEHQQPLSSPITTSSVVTMSTTSTATIPMSPVHHSAAAKSPTSPQVVVEMRSKSQRASRPNSLENSRKSRSLENLLNASESETHDISLGATTRGAISRRHHFDNAQMIMNASEMYGQPIALDIVKRQRARMPIRHADTHQSNSSISSNGSHSSLHGSLEIIQVS